MTRSNRLLVVESDLAAGDLLQSMLERIGYAWEGAASGREALQRLERGGIAGVVAGSAVPGLELLGLAAVPKAAGWLVACPVRPEGPARTTPWQAARAVWLRAPFHAEDLRLALEYGLHGAADCRYDARQREQAALLAHEFRSPLASIRTTAETLSKGYCGALSPAQSEAIGSIERNCDYLGEVAACVGALHDLDDPAALAWRDDIDLAGALGPVLSRAAYRDNPKRMTFELDLGAPVHVAGDPRLLRIVIDNLISNAIKYGRAGTPVRITVCRAGARGVLAVRNEGIGIPAADMDRLFRPFGRLRQPGSEGTKGSGLGLYLCRRIVAMLGGSIDVQSEPGSYAEFRVALDASRCADSLP